MKRPKLSSEQKAQIEAEANKIYDESNPWPLQHIRVPKDECIKRATKKLGFAT